MPRDMDIRAPRHRSHAVKSPRAATSLAIVVASRTRLAPTTAMESSSSGAAKKLRMAVEASDSDAHLVSLPRGVYFHPPNYSGPNQPDDSVLTDAGLPWHRCF